MSSKRRADGQLVTVVGASGSGKSLYTMRACRRASRLIVWDSHLEWCELGPERVHSIPELARACSTRQPRHLAYVGPTQPQRDARGRVIGPDPFEGFCRIALLWSQLAPCTVVVEELAEVSNPSKAPRAWGELIRWARKLGTTVYGITQRPAESDKTLIANSHRIICHALNGELDERYMRNYLRAPLADIQSLNFAELEYLERLPNRTIRRAKNAKPKARENLETPRSV